MLSKYTLIAQLPLTFTFILLHISRGENFIVVASFCHWVLLLFRPHQYLYFYLLFSQQCRATNPPCFGAAESAADEAAVVPVNGVHVCRVV